MLEQLLLRSDLLMQNIQEVLHHPLYDHSARIGLSAEYVILSLEHAAAVRCLLEAGIMSSAPVLLRCQFESLLRAMWVFYCSSGETLEKLETSLLTGPDQANASMPTASGMLNELDAVPLVAAAVATLREFQTYSWKPLNSYVHSGDHPLWRQVTGYPPELSCQLLQQSNGLAFMAAMQLAILTGVNGLQKELLKLNDRFRECLPMQPEANPSATPTSVP
ncbi:MAG TPA: hypothetical protein DEO93_08385 [Stenotrophomonas sp.]|uniref:DUF6988 family protein n=1 Tax=Stenotrophomonas sp. SrG TaxID=3414430 RepID=UPI000EE522BD|nr:hypothetical protein [Stenotrophomonas sp.]